jgi:predicted RNA-binding Zn ribbon-like protein
MVASLVSKVADRPLVDVDPEANVLAYFDAGAEIEDQESAAAECANEILFEAGYPVEV